MYLIDIFTNLPVKFTSAIGKDHPKTSQILDHFLPAISDMLHFAKAFFTCIKATWPRENRYGPINDTTSVMSTLDQADVITVLQKTVFREETLDQFQHNVTSRQCRLWCLVNEYQR
jgi:hypothetical protein